MRATLARDSMAIAVLLALAAAPAFAQDSTPNAISDIRQESGPGSTRLVIECSGPMAYTYYSPDPLTLVVDIPEMDTSALSSRIDVGTPEVESLRLTQMARADGRSLARIEVRLASLVPYQIYSKDRALHLVFEQTAEARAAALVPEPAPAPEPAAIEQIVEREPVVSLPAPEPVVLNGPPATGIFDISHSYSGGRLTVDVAADGQLDYQDFFLGNPDRLVFDFMDVDSRVGARRYEIGTDGVQRARVAQFSTEAPKVARLVLDLDERAPYHIVPRNNGLTIVFGEGEPPAPALLAALRPEPIGGNFDASLAGPRIASPVLPALQEPELPREPTLIEAEGSDGSSKWQGHPISLDFKDGDLQDIFRLFADITGLNVVVNPGISGRVTLVLREVPWDQSLDLILKINGLGYTIEDNVLRIATLADMQKEQADLRKLEEEKQLAGTLETRRWRLSYAKASELQPTIQKVALSSRGNITLDSRTNTMIITDLPNFLGDADELIDELDRPTPQVEIEARIVVTSRNFTRDIGVQWGFSRSQLAELGTSTNRSFPNQLVVNGQGAQSTQGLPADAAGLLDPNSTIGTQGRGYAVNLPASGFTSALGVSMGNIIGSFNLDAAITALEREGRGRLLSSPRITTQNNQMAEIKQGTQIPIQTVANNTVTVAFQDAVLTLKVTPQITNAGTVILGLEVENNSPDFGNLVGGIPPINTQAATTNVLVANGATAVIGGIYQSQEDRTQNRTPFLSKIPLIGLLFRSNFVQTTNQELLIFVTPRIIEMPRRVKG